MRNVFLFIITLILMGFVSAQAEDKIPEKSTLLYLFSQKGDYVGLGKEFLYNEDNVKFTFKFQNEQNLLNVFIVEEDENGRWGDRWSIHLQAPKGQKLSPGIYNKARRFESERYAAVDFGGCGRGCNTIIGNFEIKELEIDDDGNVIVFALNFTQHCESVNRNPLFGAIRYNSSVPVQASVSQVYGTRKCPESFVYYKTKGPGEEEEVKFIKTNRDSEFNYLFYDEGDEGVLINIGKSEDLKKIENEIYHFERNKILRLDLNTINEKGFVTGLYESSDNDEPHNRSSYKEGKVRLQIFDDHSQYLKGEFKVIKIVKSKQGKIKELAINFKAKNYEGAEIEGALRYNTNTPFDLFNPFNLSE